ncbi:MAG: NAD(P)-dependent alcohol dehydrogenase [bacterium]
MPEKIKAAVLYKPKDIRIEEVDMPEIGRDEVLVRVKNVGVCGSDVHYYNTGRIGSFVVKKPLILGHECSGEVADAGEDVKSLRVGDRVALEPGIPCRRCSYCKTGRYNLCPDVVFMATPPIDGAFVQYVKSPEDFAFKLPDNVSLAEGAMIEPLAVGMHATARGEVKPGDSVAVLGAGTIGLVTLQSAKAQGATTLIATDIDEHRLEFAKKLGATHTINAKKENPVEAIVELTGGLGVDAAFETAGSIPTTQQTISAVRRGGKIVWVGLAGEEEFPINVVEAISKEVDIKGVFRYANVYPQAIRLVSGGAIDLKSMITHKYTLDQTKEALEFADARKDVAIKVMVNVQ